MKFYIYEISTKRHLATITANTEDDCETQAIAMFGTDVEYAWTTTPNFGKPDGLKRCKDAIVLDDGFGG